ncbi:hypothetical protein LZQ00_05525 [Sphingobacterium sp. SRCM116780]|uniref:hypothetical protein n=1 Tax=Sphingobacterium sp. SRCM116780 TaxID=2907623 RepID=UPI001F3E8E27|nr:hypothetical protein [Sphingobacterium sp. SRCM116780]UIR57274.1 hypothetical protein LZQ00_05525 [Sphingobacterium sp. SRCM116780]
MEKNFDKKPHSSDEEVPEVVKNEPDDVPAAKTIHWAVWVAIIIMLIVFVYMWRR